MPYYDSKKGPMVYKEDLCKTCKDASLCNVMTDLDLREADSDYHESIIDECPSYKEYEDIQPIEGW